MVSNILGMPVEKSKVVCIHEEDAGLLWKHVDYRLVVDCCGGTLAFVNNILFYKALSPT